MNMNNKYKKILLWNWIIVITIMFAAAMAGFANGLNVTHKESGEWQTTIVDSIYRLMFFDRRTIFENQWVLILSFGFLMLAFVFVLIVFILNLCGRIHKTFNLALTISAMALLLVSAMIMFFICPIICTSALYTSYYKVILGVGSLVWAILCCIGLIVLGVSIFINKKLLKGMY